MAPLIILTIGTALFRLLGLFWSYFDGWQPALRGGLALMFVMTGIAHFDKRRQDLIAMVPPRLPNPGTLVTLTGVLELAGAIGLLIPDTARLAAICFVALLIVMFPANVYAARTGVGLGGRAATPLALRSAIQVVLIAAAITCAW